MSFFLPAMDPEIRTRRWPTVAVVILATGLIIFGITYSARAIGPLRARKAAAEGEAYLAQNRLLEAAACARKSLEVGGTNLRGVRLGLETYGNLARPEAVQFWWLLAKNPSATADDHRALLEWAIRWRQKEFAKRQWEIVRQERPMRGESIALGAEYYELTGAVNEAVSLAEARLKSDPEDINTRLLLGRVLIKAGGIRDREIGKRLLLEQMSRNDSHGLNALRFLASTAILTSFEADDCRRVLRSHPLRSSRDILTEAGFESQITPYKRESILRDGVRRYFGKKGSAVEAARWLTSIGAGQLVPEVIRADEAVESRELFLAYIDGLGEREDWESIDRLLERATLPIQPLEAALYRAHAALKQDETRIAALQWEQVLAMAGEKAEDLLIVAGFARRVGAPKVAEEACRKVIDAGGEMAREGYNELLRGCDGDLRRGYAVLEEMAHKYPGDPTILNDLTYAGLLLKERGPEAIGVAERLVKEAPEKVACRATLALAWLKSGASAKAKAAMEQQGSDWTRFQPYQMAIYAAACAAAGDREFANEILRKVDTARLKKEERELSGNPLLTPL